MQTIKTNQTKFFSKYLNEINIDIDLKKALINAKQGDLNFYDVFPFLFIDSFSISEDNVKIKNLAISVYLYFIYITTNDEFIDSNFKNFEKNYSIINFSCEESLKILSHLFDSKNNFWKIWYKRKATYYKSIDIEKKGEIFCNKEYFKLAIYKSNISLATIDALHSLSNYNYSTNYIFLCKSLNYFTISTQIIDDLQDIEQDLKQNQFNFFVNLAYEELGNRNIDSTTIKTYLHSSRTSLKYYKIAQNFYKKSLFYANKTNSDSWKLIVSNNLNKNLHRIDTLVGFYKIQEFKISLGNITRKSFDKVNLNNLDLRNKLPLVTILKDFECSFKDLSHVMYLSNVENFTIGKNILVGLNFQLSIVADLLIDISKLLNIDLDKYIDYSISIIKKNRLKRGVQAWSYFSKINEIAPDIDDFGQVLQLLIKNKQFKFIKENCYPLINFSIKNNTTKDNIFLTWLIPLNGKTDFQIKQSNFNKKWGSGPDIEVVANYIYSLVLLNEEKYDRYIKINIEWLKNKQNNDGFWDCKWYYGIYYSTYICIKVLRTYNSDKSNVLEKASSFLTRMQNNDGGWGYNNFSDPLSTSFAIISLKYIDSKLFRNYIDFGIKYLQLNQDQNGNWKAINFIKPRINDPYRSKIITNAYVLKAINM